MPDSCSLIPDKELFVEITAEMVKELRQVTGAGVLDCRKALETAGGDFDKADRDAAREGPGRCSQEGRRARPRKG